MKPASSINARLKSKPFPVETAIVKHFVRLFESNVYPDQIPMTPGDTVLTEHAYGGGRADLVVVHADQSITVIEVKDGRHGMIHVAGGLGQACVYGAMAARQTEHTVRGCLLWTAINNRELDTAISDACVQANVIPLLWPRTVDLFPRLFP